MSDAMKLLVKDISTFERDVTLRMPFRFGVVTLTESPSTAMSVELVSTVRSSLTDRRDMTSRPS